MLKSFPKITIKYTLRVHLTWFYEMFIVFFIFEFFYLLSIKILKTISIITVKCTFIVVIWDYNEIILYSMMVYNFMKAN